MYNKITLYWITSIVFLTMTDSTYMEDLCIRMDVVMNKNIIEC